MSETVIVRVTQGDLRGRKIIRKPGVQYYSFQGIPYAKPPVGNLRFQVSSCILRKKDKQFFLNLKIHSYILTACTVVAMSTNCFNTGRAMAQAVSCRPLTAEARVRSWVSPCEICGGQGGTGPGCSPSCRFSPVNLIPLVLH